MDGRLVGWLDGWMDGWMYGWLDGWTGEGRSRIFLIKNPQTLLSIKNKRIVPSRFSEPRRFFYSSAAVATK